MTHWNDTTQSRSERHRVTVMNEYVWKKRSRRDKFCVVRLKKKNHDKAISDYYATLVYRAEYFLAIFHSKTWECLKHTSSLLNFQSAHDFASHSCLLIHNPGNNKCQKCPAGPLNIHIIQNLSPPSKISQLLFTSTRHFVLNMYLSFSISFHQQQNTMEMLIWYYCTMVTA